MNVEIGRYCSVAEGVCIEAISHPLDWLSTAPFQYRENPWEWLQYGGDDLRRKIIPYSNSKQTIIENDVWIGRNAIIMNGLKICNGAIISAGAIVAHDVPPYAIVAGSPAKIIRYRFNEILIEKLQWWKFPIWSFVDIPFDKIELAINTIKK